MTAISNGKATLQQLKQRCKVAALKQMCKDAGLPHSGVKADLINRLIHKGVLKDIEISNSLSVIDKETLQQLEQRCKVAALKQWCKDAGLPHSGVKADLINRLRHNGVLKDIEISNLLSPIDKESKKGTNKKGSTANALENENRMCDNINDPNSYISKKISEELQLPPETKMSAKKVNKKNGCTVRHTDQWKQNKKGTKERRASAKADIQISFDENSLSKKLGLSMKSGKGRITSADCYETCAILKSVKSKKYNGTGYNELEKIIERIIESMENLHKYKPIKNNSTLTTIREEMKQNHDLKNDDTDWVNNLDETTKECNKLWNELKNNYPEFVKDVLYEGITGEYKFGDNDGRAHILIVTKSSDSQEIYKIFDIRERREELDLERREELDNYLEECAKGENPFKCKTGGTGKEMWVRFL